jgi:UDP-glucuronate decarboxylase
VGVLQRFNQRFPEKPITIIALDNLITGLKDNPFFEYDDKNFIFTQHDVIDPLEVEHKVDYVMHAAGIASPVYYAKYPLETINATVEGLKNVINFSLENKPESIVYFSSSEIYGDPHPDFIPTPETYYGHVSSTGLRACYDESKRMGETIATVYHRLHDLPIKIIRPFNVYGPGMHVRDQRVLPNFLNAALEDKTIEIHNRGEQTRTFCYAGDAVEGFFRVMLLGKNGEAYNIGSDQEEISMIDLAKRVEKVHGKKLDIKLSDYPAGYPVGDPNRRLPDITKARTQLGYDPQTSLDTGLERMLEWYRIVRG